MNAVQLERRLQSIERILDQLRSAGRPRYLASTYTPTMVGGTSAGTTTYDSQLGTYVIIGGLCVVSGVVTWTAATGTGEMRFSLPFAVKTGKFAIPSLRLNNVTYASTPVQGLANEGWSYFRLERATSNASTVVIDVEAAGSVIWTIAYEYTE